MAEKTFAYDDEELAFYDGELHKRSNGWTNYETWTIHLWLTKEEDSKKATVELCKDGDEFAAAQRLKAMVEEGVPDMEGSLYTDLMVAAMTNANWMELATAFRS